MFVELSSQVLLSERIRKIWILPAEDREFLLEWLNQGKSMCLKKRNSSIEEV